MPHRKLLSRISQIDLERLGALEVPIPKREYDRLLVLRQCNLLDTQTDESYDRFTTLCARYFQLPIVIISLLDTDRQWFKSRVGLAAQQTSRDVAFCAYTILEETPRAMIVPDAHDDSRFRNNPLVIGPPFIRFYAGASLIIEGIKVGTICLINDEPNHNFTSAQEEILIGIADAISEMMIDRRQRLLDAHLNGVQMHQSLLTLFRQPFQFLHQSFDQLQAQLKILNELSVAKANNGDLWSKFFDQITYWEVSVEHVSHVLEIMLRYITRIVLLLQQDQTNEVYSLSSIENVRYLLETHHQDLLALNNTIVKCRFLPWRHDVWFQELHELFTCFHVPIGSITYRTNTVLSDPNKDILANMSQINTHPDVLYLVLLAITEQLSLDDEQTSANLNGEDHRKKLRKKFISDLQVIQDDEHSLMHMVISLQHTATSSVSSPVSSSSSSATQDGIALETSTLDAIDTLLSYVRGKLYCETVQSLNPSDSGKISDDIQKLRKMSASPCLYVTKIHVSVPSSNQSYSYTTKDSKESSTRTSTQPPSTMFSSHAYNSFLYKQSYLAQHATKNRPKMEHLVNEAYVSNLATFQLPLVPMYHDTLHENGTMQNDLLSVKNGQILSSSPVIHHNNASSHHDPMSPVSNTAGHISQMAFQLWSQWMQPHLSSPVVVPIDAKEDGHVKTDKKTTSLLASSLTSPFKHNKVVPFVDDIDDISEDDATTKKPNSGHVPVGIDDTRHLNEKTKPRHANHSNDEECNDMDMSFCMGSLMNHASEHLSSGTSILNFD